MKLLVTGGAGLLGASFQLTALERGHQVAAVYHHHRLAATSQSVDLDLGAPDAPEDAIRLSGPDWVIHCAALTDVDWCQTHPQQTLAINAELPRRLARAASRAGAGFLFISTDSVFDGKRGSYGEVDDPNPLNTYARSKLAGELAVAEECPNHLIARTTIYGWNAVNKQSIGEWIVARLESGLPVHAFTDAIFSPLLVNDLADLLLDAIRAGLRGLYHIGASDASSKYAFATMAADIFGLDKKLVVPTSIDDFPYRAPRPKNTSLRTDRASLALGALPTVQQGLRRFAELQRQGYPRSLKRMLGR